MPLPFAPDLNNVFSFRRGEVPASNVLRVRSPRGRIQPMPVPGDGLCQDVSVPMMPAMLVAVVVVVQGSSKDTFCNHLKHGFFRQNEGTPPGNAQVHDVRIPVVVVVCALTMLLFDAREARPSRRWRGGREAEAGRVSQVLKTRGR